MPDYHAVLKKTLAGLPNNTAELRAKVYDKARQTIRRQLDAVQPSLPLERIELEVANLETAIVDVEAEQAPPEPVLPPEADILGDLEAELGVTPSEPELPEAAPAVPSAPSAPSVGSSNYVAASSAPVAAPIPQAPLPPEVAPAPSAAAAPGAFAPSEPLTAPVAPAPPPPSASSSPGQTVGAPSGRLAGDGPRQPEKRSRKGVVAFVVILLLLLGGAIAATQAPGGLNGLAQRYAPDLEIPFLGIGPTEDAVVDTVPQATDAEPVVQPAASDEETKFNERLGSDGSTTVEETVPVAEPEQPDLLPADPTDPTVEGPAEGVEVEPTDEPQPGDVVVDENGVEFTVPITPVDEAAPTADDQSADAPAAEPSADPSTSATVAQRAFFYVENGGAEGTTRIPGSVIWSNGEREGVPTIEGDVAIDELGVGVKMVIRRNLDETLSASHVIDILFDLPDGFSGNGIDAVRQVVFKPTEEEQGNALIAEPAKISDTFFLVALYDLPEAEAANTQIMRDRPWIDLPIAYTTGRRALLTLEKGARGSDVFRTAFDAWAQIDG